LDTLGLTWRAGVVYVVTVPAPFVVDEYVRWSDVDKAGIIFYGAYFRFFEIAETELFRAAAVPYGQVFDRFNIWLPRVHLDCDFHYPARLDDRLRVATYFTRFGTSSIAIAFDVLHVGARQLAATGHVVLVCTDRESLRPRALPGALRTQLTPFLLTAAAARASLGLSEGA
jgi:YbgC/YbaW family acyl-CoA thioester hydrolase